MPRASEARWILGIVLASLAAARLGEVRAEPYIALQNGLVCSACHENRTGGGLRTRFGAGVGRESLPWTIPSWAEGTFDGTLHERVRVGADFRGVYRATLPDAQENRYVGEFAVAEANLYASLEVIPERLSIVVDETLAPGGAAAREAFALLKAGPAGLYGKVGKFHLPFGWRLHDDDAATRRFTGFTFAASDVGLEVGADPGPTTLALAISNGTDGAAETDNGKQVTFRAEYASRLVRAGTSGTVNDRPGSASRKLGGLFAGVVTGPVVWLGEWDAIEDTEEDRSRIRGSAAHVEAVWQVRKGLAFRAWAGRYDPDREVTGDDLDQAGLGVDCTPLPGLQFRAYYRMRQGPPDDSQNRDDRVLAEIHVYF